MMGRERGSGSPIRWVPLLQLATQDMELAWM